MLRGGRRADDDDRAVSMVGASAADGAEQPAGQAAAPAGADDQQCRALGFVDQDGERVAHERASQCRSDVGLVVQIFRFVVQIEEDDIHARENLRNTKVRNNVGDGIYVTVERPLYLTDSQVSDNGGKGVTDHESALVPVRGEFSKNGGYGISEEEWGVDLESDQANNNGSTGIFLSTNVSGDTYTLLNNMARKNGRHGIVFAPCGTPDHPLVASGNVARHNATDPQCVNIACTS